MKNHLLWSSCLAALLVWTVACTKANFEPIVGDAAGAGGTGGTTDTGGSGPPDASEPCSPPVTACSSTTVPTIGCDPVCQSGDCDWCGKKCTWVAAGISPAAACVPMPSVTQASPFEQCTTYSAGTPDQTDNCIPGNICLPPNSGAASHFCFQLCASSDDCLGGTPCGQRPLYSGGSLSVSVCDPRGQSCATTCCNPVDSSGVGCPLAGDHPGAQYCYLVSPDLTQPAPAESQTVCEFSSGGSQTSCTTARDCLPKHTCVAGVCKQVCSLTTGCASGVACTMRGKEYGYCSS